MRPTRHARKGAFSLAAHTLDLPLEEKLAYGGALVAVIATLLPWFSFDAEHAYNGLQNVTWLIGYSVLLLSILTLVPWVCALLGVSPPPVLTRQTWHWGITGGTVLLLSLITLSIYSSFEWISIHSTIHFGLYVTLLGGVLVLVASFLNRSKARRPHGHLAHVERSVALEDEEIERYLQRDPIPPRHAAPSGTDPVHGPKADPAPERPEKERNSPPAMFDL